MFKKLLISLLIALLFFAQSILPYFVPSARAQWYNPDFAEFTDKVFDSDNPDEIFGERYTYAQIVWILHSLSAILVPDIILACFSDAENIPGVASSCLVEVLSELTGLDLGYSTGSSNLADTIDVVISKNPVSGIGYVKNTISKLHIIPEVRAQGFGFNNLSPLQTMWQVTRNASYALLIVAFIIMAFMVMFRVKISPQTIITVQSALPRLIIILILITFSYAIAGFVVDLAFVVLGLIAALAGTASTLPPIDLFNLLISTKPITAMFIGTIIAAVAGTIFGVGGVGAFFSGWAILAVVFLFIPAVVMFLITLLFLVMLLRIAWLMIKTFITIILLVIASPILILMGVFPTSGGFGTWLKNLASHVAVFPTIALMFFFAHFIFWSSINTGGGVGELLAGIGILNPYGIDIIGGGGTIVFPGFRLGDPTLFGFITSFGILFLVPNVGKMIQSLISGRPFAYGTAFGEAIAPVSWAGGKAGDFGPVREIRGAYSREMGRRIAEGVQDAASASRFQTVRDIGKRFGDVKERLEPRRP